MEWWQPAEGQEVLWAWWAPLLRFAERARAERVPWPVVAADFSVVGRVDRRPRPPVWVYRHRVGGGEVRVDDRGRPYRRRPDGGHVETGVRRAVWAAGLPDVVEPVWSTPSPSPRADRAGRADRARCTVRGRHLRLVSPPGLAGPPPPGGGWR
jgi:hypothetical protein